MKTSTEATYRLATAEDVEYVATHLRKPDQREMETLGWNDPVKPLMHGLQHSDPCYTMVTRAGKPFGLFGAVPNGHGDAVVWMMATDDLYSESMAFARGSKKIVAEWYNRYHKQSNLVDSRNTLHCKWLDWLGYKFEGMVWINEVMFYRFEMVNANV